MENPIKMDDLGKTHYFWKHPFVFFLGGFWRRGKWMGIVFNFRSTRYDGISSKIEVWFVLPTFGLILPGKHVGIDFDAFGTLG